MKESVDYGYPAAGAVGGKRETIHDPKLGELIENQNRNTQNPE
jgi:hypothetical protein